MVLVAVLNSTKHLKKFSTYLLQKTEKEEKYQNSFCEFSHYLDNKTK